MELPGSNTEKFLIFSQKKVFIIFLEMEPCTFHGTLPKLDKWTKIRPETIFYTLILKSSYMFLKESLFYCGKRKPRKNSLYFRKRNFLISRETSYISATGNNFPSSKGKKNTHLDFRKRNFLATSLKNPFFYGNPLEFFITFFSGVFIFYHRFLPLFFGFFYCWFHFFMSPVLQLFCQVLRFCVVVPRLLRIW